MESFGFVQLSFVVGIAACVLASFALQGSQGPTGPAGPRGFSVGRIFYLNYNDPAMSPPIGTYYSMSEDITVVGLQTIIVNNVANDSLIAQFVTNPNIPDVNTIPSGVWDFHQHINSVVQTGSPVGPPAFYIKVFLYDGITETEIATSQGGLTQMNVLNYNQWYDTPITILNSISIQTTDRLIFRIYAFNITADYTVEFSFGSNTPSELTTTLSATQGATGATGPSGLQGPSGTTLTQTYATAYSTSTQLLTAGTAANIAHSINAGSNGITIATGASSYFQVPDTGIYKIIPSLQYLSAGNGNIHIWIKTASAPGYTYSNVPATTTLVEFKNNEEDIVTTEYLVSLTANDRLQVWALALNSNCNIQYYAAGGVAPNNYPAAPGIITNMYRIA